MPSNDGRIHLRVPGKLKEEMQAYAERHHSSLTDMIIRLYTKAMLEEKRELQEPKDAEQV